VGRDLVDLGRADPVDPVDRTDRAAPAAPAALRPVDLDLAVRVGPGVLGLVVRVDLVDLTDLAALDRMAPVAPDRTDLAAPGVLDPVVLDITAPVGLVAPVDRMVPVGLVAPVDRMGPVAPVDRMGLVGLVGLDTTDLVVPGITVPVAPVDRTDQVVPVAPVDRTDQLVPVAPVDRTDLVVLGDLVRMDRVALVVLGSTDRRRRTCNAGTTTVVARSGADRGTRHTASARPITVPRPRRGKMDSGGTVDLHREHHRPTGTAHRLLAAGTGRRPPVAGILSGTARRAT
jgi:hypothetical protein